MLADKSSTTLTPDDVFKAVNDLLAHGWGELRVIVQDGYIATVHKSETWRGVKPSRVTPSTLD